VLNHFNMADVEMNPENGAQGNEEPMEQQVS
jgi:hypothetical protein